MNIDEIKRLYNRRYKVEFRLYGMEYTIMKVQKGAIIFPNIYNDRPTLFDNVDLLLNNYTIFNESIINCQNDIKNIR